MTTAIIVAAGSSRRMGFNKLLAPLAGVPVLRRSLVAFHDCAEVDEILVIASEEAAAVVRQWQTQCGLGKLRHILPGGAERHLSVWAGLRACAAETDIVAVHDGARPLISPVQISRCIAAARELGAAACARPLTETVKRADASGRITGSLDREGVWIMETPQVFHRALLIRAYELVMREQRLVTDEVSAVQHLGSPVHVVKNNSPNPKITFPEDLALAEKMLHL